MPARPANSNHELLFNELRIGKVDKIGHDLRVQERLEEVAVQIGTRHRPPLALQKAKDRIELAALQPHFLLRMPPKQLLSASIPPDNDMLLQ
jgi:hypothetical protein